MGAAVREPAGLQRPLARPRSIASRSCICNWRSWNCMKTLSVSSRVLVGRLRPREKPGPVRCPQQRGQKVPGGLPRPRRKRPLSSRENFAGQFRKPPHPLPHGGQWRFVLPSLPPTVPSTPSSGARGPPVQDTQQGHCGRVFASRTKGRVMLEGDQWNEVVHPPALPYVLGGNQRPPFSRWGHRSSQVLQRWPSSHTGFSSGIRAPSLESRALGRVTQKTKG